MSVISEKQFLFNYGWDHFWYDPKYLRNLGIREFIKGPFRRLKLVNSVPFVTRCQQDGTSVVFREGIPDCWAEYLTQKFRFSQIYLRNYELMHKEDVDVVPHLRKYRLYLGQGIPDPWTAYPYNSELLSYKDTELRKRLKKEERCLCCEREYLFGCPDTCVSNANQCSCKDCHSKNPSTSEPTEKCRCHEFFHYWVLESSRKKHRRGNSGDALSSPDGSHSETEAEGRHLKDRNKFVAFCECYKSLKCCDCNDNSGLGGGDHESNEKTFKCINRFLKQQSKVYFCPYLKTFYRRKALETNKNFDEAKTSVSKEIQTEIQTIKSSKTVQTEKPETKIQSKCTCLKKCFGCCVLFNRSCLKAGCPALHSIPSFHCSSCFTPKPAFVCPYSVTNHFTVQKHCKNETGDVKRRHKKKNQLKERVSEIGSNMECRFDQQEERGDAAPKSKINDDSQEHEPAEAHENLKCNKNIYNSQAPSTTFDHLKYLADYKLKGFLQQEEIFPGTHKNKFLHQITGANSRFKNVCRGNSSLNNVRREGVSSDRFKPFMCYKPRYSESSFPENKFYLRKSNPLNIRRFSSCDQATMTSNIEPENLESEVLIKESISRESVDSDELKTDGFVRNQEVTRAFGKRRKLLRNRKRRRKLVASILGYQDSLTKPSKRVGYFKKEVRPEGTSQDYGHSKKISNPSFTSSACHLNVGENCGSRFSDMRNPEFSFARNSREISKKQLGKLTSQIHKKC